ncbi:alpha/beta hydrolase [Azohydromonas sp. G-1-1-14]|uniref:Alpha/beta hydrolase n=2 Tax=Azohydromonas caseinilytica TaxID=2728836 RepID=A0A848FEW0_9BURK|nr:alpha/beta hydrolase [Azohydromonas caseinilytica]
MDGAQAGNTARPWVLHFHGGAFTRGSLGEGAPVARALAAAGATVAALDYPLAPEAPFPQAIELGHAVLRWLALPRHARRRGALLVAGEEAGGNLAAAVALMARDRAGPALAGQILLSPLLDVCVATASQRQAGAGAAGCPCDAGWRAYLPRPADAAHPYATPGTALRLARLPRSLLLTAADDPLRDETRAYARRLGAAGVPVELRELGEPTGWPASYARAADAPWSAALRRHLHRFLHDLSL